MTNKLFVKFTFLMFFILNLQFAFSRELITSEFCPIGCPKPSVLEKEGTTQTIFGEVYAVSFNHQKGFSDWVAYQIEPIYFGKVQERYWKNDPRLFANVDFKNAVFAYASANEFDRGDLVPIATFGAHEHIVELNYLTNTIPQKSQNKQGIWRYLEGRVRLLAAKNMQTAIYAVTGTIYDSKGSVLLGSSIEHDIPDKLYKLVYSIYERNVVGYAAFAIPQTESDANKLCDYVIDLETLKAETRFSFFDLAVYVDDSRSLKVDLGC